MYKKKIKSALISVFYKDGLDDIVRELDRLWPQLGRRLVQSSWGPTVVAFAPTEFVAVDLRREIMDRYSPDHWHIEIVSPLNEGASIRESNTLS